MHYHNMMYIFALYLIVTYATALSLDGNYIFLSNYFQFKDVPFVTLVLCGNKNEMTSSTKKIYAEFEGRGLNILPPEYLLQRISAFDRIFNIPFSKSGIVLDYDCFGGPKILELASQRKYFRYKYNWLIFNGNSEEPLNLSDSLIKQMSTLNLSVDAEITLVYPKSVNSSAFNLYDAYNPGYIQGGFLNISKIGEWSSSSYLTIDSAQSKYERRIDMQGIMIRAATVRMYKGPIPIEEYLRDRKTAQQDSFQKFNFALVMHLKDINNFRLNMSVTDKWFGLDGGQPGGIQKLLMEEQIDISATSGLMKVDRVDMLDFFIPTWPFRTCFIFRNPESVGSIRNIFIMPFANDTWYGFLILAVIIMIVTRLTQWADYGLLFGGYSDAWSAAALVTLGAFCQQGTSMDPCLSSGRLTLIILLSCSVLLYNYYTSSVVSSLLSSQPPTLTTIKELGHSTLAIALEDVVYTKTLFKVTKDPDIQYLYEKKIDFADMERSPYMPPMAGLSLVKAGGYAYHGEPNSLYSLIEHAFEPSEICQLSEINLFSPSKLSLMAQKNSPYSKHFALGIRRMNEVGILDRELHIWYARKPECLASTVLVSVGMEQVSPAIIVLSLGMAVSLVFFLWECRGKYKSRYHQFIKRKTKRIHNNN